jgi:hypothetical protein
MLEITQSLTMPRSRSSHSSVAPGRQKLPPARHAGALRVVHFGDLLAALCQHLTEHAGDQIAPDGDGRHLLEHQAHQGRPEALVPAMMRCNSWL